MPCDIKGGENRSSRRGRAKCSGLLKPQNRPRPRIHTPASFQAIVEEQTGSRHRVMRRSRGHVSQTHGAEQPLSAGIYRSTILILAPTATDQPVAITQWTAQSAPTLDHRESSSREDRQIHDILHHRFKRRYRARLRADESSRSFISVFNALRQAALLAVSTAFSAALAPATRICTYLLALRFSCSYL